MATMNLNVLANPIIPCGGTVAVSGTQGIYQVNLQVGSATGYTGIRYNAQGIPDRFQLYYNNVLVADSKYVGDLLTGTPPSYPELLGTKSLQVREYNGTTFINTGETRNIIITQDDIANGTTEPTAGSGLIYFNKVTVNPTTVQLVVTGPISSTAWSLQNPGVICPQPDIPT